MVKSSSAWTISLNTIHEDDKGENDEATEDIDTEIPSLPSDVRNTTLDITTFASKFASSVIGEGLESVARRGQEPPEMKKVQGAPPEAPTKIGGPPEAPTKIGAPPESPTKIGGPPNAPTKKDAKKLAEDLGKDLSKGQPAPDGFLPLHTIKLMESILQQIAHFAGRGGGQVSHEIRVVSQRLSQSLGTISKQLHEELGISPDEYRPTKELLTLFGDKFDEIQKKMGVPDSQINAGHELFSATEKVIDDNSDLASIAHSVATGFVGDIMKQAMSRSSSNLSMVSDLTTSTKSENPTRL
jgi:hypothetical protein